MQGWWSELALEARTVPVVRSLLDHNRSGTHVSAAHKRADLDLYEVASAKLAVDRKVEQCPVSDALLAIKEKANGPYLLWLQCSLCPDELACIP